MEIKKQVGVYQCQRHKMSVISELSKHFLKKVFLSVYWDFWEKEKVNMGLVHLRLFVFPDNMIAGCVNLYMQGLLG